MGACLTRLQHLPEHMYRRPGESLRGYLSRLSRHRSDVSRFVVKYAPFRHSVSLFDFAGRNVGIGINTLMVLCSRTRGCRFPMHIRGIPAHAGHAVIGLGEAAGSYHVVPAGTFQPLTPELSYDEVAHSIEFS